MKYDIKTTRAEASSNYNIILADWSDYDIIKELLQQRENFYNCGVYGWNWSALFCDCVSFFKAYRSTPAGSKNSYNLKEYNKVMKTIKKHIDYKTHTYREREAWINKNRYKYIDLIIEAIKKDLKEAE